MKAARLKVPDSSEHGGGLEWRGFWPWSFALRPRRVVPFPSSVVTCPPYLPNGMRALLLTLLALVACVAISSAATQPYTRTFASFAELRAATPSATGEIVFLLSYVAGQYKGAGQFVGNLTAAADDGGVIASSGANYHWKRTIEDYETLNVLHFGAIHDGTTDDHDAVVRMWNWSRAQTGVLAGNGIRLVEGNILISPIDISDQNVTDFAIYGPTTPYGVRPLVYILSDRSAKPVFTVSAPRVVLRGLGWNGRVTGTVDANRAPLTQTNYQGFFKNVLAGVGQTIQVHGFQSSASGGHVFDVMDLVQSKFDQVYSSTCYGNVWNIGWSGADGTEWDHPRSVEISNVNLQSNYGSGAITAPRMEQGTLRNIWIEHSRIPGDINSGQWIIDALNIESSLFPLNMNNTRDITRQMSLQSGGAVTRGNYTGDSWLPVNKQGWIRQEAYGILANAPVASLWEASMIRGNNTGSVPLWLNIGRFETQAVGGLWEIEILSRVGTGSASGVRPTDNGAPGLTRIFLQRGAADSPTVTYTHEGSPGVTNVRYYPIGSSYCVIYAYIAPGVNEYGVFIRGTGITRHNSGVWNYFSVSGQLTETINQYYPTATSKTSIHNGEAGIGAEGAIATVDTVTVDASQVNATEVSGFMIMKINGVDYAVPYYEAPDDIPQDPPQGVPPSWLEPPPSAPGANAASALAVPSIFVLLSIIALFL